MPKEFEIVGAFSETVYAHVELPDTVPDSALQLACDGVLNVIRTALDPDWAGEPLRVEPKEIKKSK